MENTNTLREKENPNENEFQEFLSTLPKETKLNKSLLYLYQGFWCPSIAIKPIISFQNHFKAHNSDIILASIPNSGTTWLKAVIYLITNRAKFSLNQTPLLTSSPHDLVPFFELDLYLKTQSPVLESVPDPRIFATHMPYTSLKSSIKDSNCRIVYVYRNPLDQFISYWQFSLKLPHNNVDPLPLEEAFELYCRGIHSFGPFWDHVLGYWKESVENPDKVLLLKYEHFKEDNIAEMKRLAKFLGFPFSTEEEEDGAVEEISRICSFENMKNLEGNKNGRRPAGAPNNAFFRKGKVGDWSNYLTPLMAEHLNKIIQEKFEGSGLI